ncbi:TIM-barrel domain-containing protein [Paenibacillus sp. FSL M7-1455]|jgi:alpha-D-xyloside xylohydrolase|uniref:Glycosyl hydrolase family 31 n=1 Tax=Paenibacillus cookii TaxID=157839 RepID=A0ABQ4LVJ0_9BACL|nr:TIM-barrel domain-containing protein [Paenibacillus cookii]GIO67284.1 glycosyl hydrolase family 31 [Paenibacillus cookii]
MRHTDWIQAAPGVWKTTLGSPEGLTPLTCMKRKPKTEAMAGMPDVPLPIEWEEIAFTELKAGGSLLSFPLGQSEELYGAGLQFMRMNQRGRTRYLRVNSDPRQDTGETHAPVPFLVSGRGYGVLVDTARAVTMYCGSTLRQHEGAAAEARDRNTDRGWKATPASDRLEIRLPPEGAAVYLFAGPGMMDAVRRYNLFCGGGVLPPRWGLGFWHRVPTLYRDEEVEREAMEFRARDIPCDVIGLEPGWHSASYPCTYEWGADRFPDPAGFVSRMRQAGFRLNLWEHPYISPRSELYGEMQALSGDYAVWGGLAPDFALEKARELYAAQHEREHVSLGIAGYKLDECDGSELTRNSWMFPAHAAFPSGHDGEQMRQLYGLLLQDITSGLYRRKNLRTYGLVRASNAGASSLPYVLYSDLYDHRQFVRALCNASFCGLLWSPEVRRTESTEDWVRRMQTVCFSPLAMLNAWGDGVKPWSDPAAEAEIRHYIRLRMRLLPYLYTVFAEYEANGTPPFPAMPLVLDEAKRTKQRAASAAGENHPDAAALNGASPKGPIQAFDVLDTSEGAYGTRLGREWDDQFCIGRDLLVAPMFAGETGRDVLLPEGVWYEAETGVRREGGRVIRVECPLERLPLFVREGAVIPMMPALSHVPEGDIPIELVHFGSAPGESLLYDDDGETFDYEQTGGCWRKVTVAKTADGSFSGTVEPGGAGSRYRIAGWRFGQTSLPPEASEPANRGGICNE